MRRATRSSSGRSLVRVTRSRSGAVNSDGGGNSDGMMWFYSRIVGMRGSSRRSSDETPATASGDEAVWASVQVAEAAAASDAGVRVNGLERVLSVFGERLEDAGSREADGARTGRSLSSKKSATSASPAVAKYRRSSSS
jgi:hypothetical protein